MKLTDTRSPMFTPFIESGVPISLVDKILRKLEITAKERAPSALPMIPFVSEVTIREAPIHRGLFGVTVKAFRCSRLKPDSVVSGETLTQWNSTSVKTMFVNVVPPPDSRFMIVGDFVLVPQTIPLSVVMSAFSLPMGWMWDSTWDSIVYSHHLDKIVALLRG